MKNQRGITLTSLIVYIVLIFVIIVILARVSVYFTSNMSEISKESASISEIDKFNMFFLKDTKKSNNKIESVSEDGTSVTFTNGAIYSFSKDNEVIYYENESDEKKIIIAETIENCKFIQSEENSKDIVKVEITVNEKVYKYEYVMGYENVYKTHETESSYIDVEELEGFAITTNTQGVTFTKSDGVTPGDPYNIQNGDIVIYGDYKYTYNSSNKGWAVVVEDKTKEGYGEIAVAVYGKPITILNNAFKGCVNLIEAPDIPETATALYGTFRDCTSLTEAPQMPTRVTYMEYTFENCTSLKKVKAIPSGATSLRSVFNNCSSLTVAPEIPEGVTYLGYTFAKCSSLKIAPEIPSTVINMHGTFHSCSALIDVPELPEGLTDIGAAFEQCTNIKKAPIIPSSVTNMDFTFSGCSSLLEAPVIPNSVTTMNTTFSGCNLLIEAPVIPSGVTNMTTTFRNCYKLQGEITINASPTTYTNCFQNSGTQGTGIILKGSSTVLNELAATNTNGKVTVSN